MNMAGRIGVMRIRLIGIVIFAGLLPSLLQGCAVVAVGAGMALAAGGVTLADRLSHDHEPDRDTPPDADGAAAQGDGAAHHGAGG
jgi:hypothetical protein